MTFEQFLLEQASNLDRKLSSKKVLVRLSHPMLVCVGGTLKIPKEKLNNKTMITLYQCQNKQ